MKKFVSIMLALAMSMSLAACGADSSAMPAATARAVLTPLPVKKS